MTIKKVYSELFEVLEANQNKKVETILPQLLELMSAKTSNKNFVTDDKGQVTHIYCYYHKKWESVEHYGLKKSSPSGYNSMCKEGVNQWTKQQRDFKKGQENLLTQLSSGELSTDKLQDELVKLEEKRKEIVPRKDGHGSDEIE